MILSPITCANCGHSNERNRGRCNRCDEKIGSGYPNVNVYSAPYFVDGLEKRYQQATVNCDTDGKIVAMNQLEQLITTDSRIVINMSRHLLFELINPNASYLPYRRAVEQGKRLYSGIFNDHRRTVVDACFYGSHGADIVFAALSLNDDGLTSYGDVSVVLDTPVVKKRVTVFERNSFDLYDNLTKGGLWNPANFPPPTGYFTTWNNRAKLAAIKCYPQLTTTPDTLDYAKIILNAAADRKEDEFIELHLYNKIAYFAFKKIKLQVRLTDRSERINWKILEKKLAEQQITVETI